MTLESCGDPMEMVADAFGWKTPARVSKLAAKRRKKDRAIKNARRNKIAKASRKRNRR